VRCALVCGREGGGVENARTRAPLTGKGRGVQAPRPSLRVLRCGRRVYASGDLDVLRPRTLRALSLVERDGLAFAQFVEARGDARRVVEEVLVPVARQNEAEPFLTDEAFDRAV